jgi:hypothetical protein
MERPFFPVESNHDVTNAQDDGTEKLRKEPAEGPAIGDPFAIGSHDPEAAGHFARRGAVFAKKICRVGNAKNKGENVLEDGAYYHLPYQEMYQESKNKAYDREDDDVDNPSANADPESGIHHFSRRGYPFPELLNKQGFASRADEGIPKSNEFIL